MSVNENCEVVSVRDKSDAPSRFDASCTQLIGVCAAASSSRASPLWEVLQDQHQHQQLHHQQQERGACLEGRGNSRDQSSATRGWVHTI